MMTDEKQNVEGGREKSKEERKIRGDFGSPEVLSFTRKRAANLAHS
jgi:hypothetical protein